VLVVGFGSQVVDSRECVKVRVVTGVSLVPRIQGVGFNGGSHGYDGCPKGLMQDDVILECSHHGDGVDQRLNVEL
jgi:hypothetical protein